MSQVGTLASGCDYVLKEMFFYFLLFFHILELENESPLKGERDF